MITGSPAPVDKESKEPEGKYSPKASEPLDLRFVKNFTQSGGNFLYCKDQSELLENIKNVCKEEQVNFLYTFEEDVKQLIAGSGVEVSSEAKKSDAICSSCEAMVADIGGVMIDDFQTGGLRLGDLPDIHIIVGKTTQIVKNLHAGLAKINNSYKQNRPGGLTTLKGPREESVRQSNNDQNAKRVLYLLLLEDELK